MVVIIVAVSDAVVVFATVIVLVLLLRPCQHCNSSLGRDWRILGSSSMNFLGGVE